MAGTVREVSLDSRRALHVLFRIVRVAMVTDKADGLSL